MDKYVFGIILRTESGMMIFQSYGSGSLGDTALWMNTVYLINENKGAFFSMPEDAFKYVQELQRGLPDGRFNLRL